MTVLRRLGYGVNHLLGMHPDKATELARQEVRADTASHAFGTNDAVVRVRDRNECHQIARRARLHPLVPPTGQARGAHVAAPQRIQQSLPIVTAHDHLRLEIAGQPKGVAAR